MCKNLKQFQYKMEVTKVPRVSEYYKNKDIFITGATGIMGKVLVEKLLRSCPEINKLYLMLRVNNGVTVEGRMKNLKSSMIFDRLKKENPLVLDKLEIITGDIAIIGLGISEESFQKLSNVSIVFHVAASIRFDDTLKNAIIINLRGTREVLLFAERLKNLEAILHTSTTYSNPGKDVVDEILYPCFTDWKTTIMLAETLDDHLLNALTMKYINGFPNTYTFTKCLAEQCVNDFKDRLPVIIYRPSIIISAMEEPVVGWFDAFVGPVGLIAAIKIGICRVLYSEKDQILDYMPVDIAIKAMVVAAWKMGVNRMRNSLPIYNCSSSSVRAFTLGAVSDEIHALADQMPYDKMLWLPNVSFQPNWLMYITQVVFTQVLPAIFFDLILRILDKQPFFLKLQRHIYASQRVNEYFSFKSYDFRNSKFLSLSDELQPEDRRDFYCDAYKNLTTQQLCSRIIIGIRRYLFKEPDKTLKRARRVYKLIYILDKLFKLLLIFSIYQVVVKYKILNFG